MSPEKKIELLAPAGNFEKLELAIHYGADALYLGGEAFSLRNYAGNFSLDNMRDAVSIAHQNKVKVYVACNVYARNSEQPDIVAYLEKLGDIAPDAVIIADPGVFMTAGEIIPHIPVHLSTQANTTNYRSVLFWEKLGIKRINVARELSLKEIGEISAQTSLEIEAFAHGAMCIAYSGRCLLSSYMVGRDSNRGDCAHSCRWSYAVSEAYRPDQYMPLEEDDRGSYIFSSKDLCMIEHVDEMIESGIVSLKIEGRMKGINYLASTVKVYREAIDAYYDSPKDYRVRKEWIEALSHVNYRGFCTGFYLGDPNQVIPNYAGSRPQTGNRFIGKVKQIIGPGVIDVEVRNKMYAGDPIEILKQKGPVELSSIEDIRDDEGQSIPFAQPGSRVTLTLSGECAPNDLIRRVTPVSA
ncbi:MAG: U32 family peptidase [Desulfobacterales bacterium]